MKKVAIIIILILTITAAAILWKSKQGGARPTAGTTAKTAVVPPVFPSAAAAQPSYTLAAPAPSFPAALPVFQTVTGADNSAIFLKTAGLLNFSGDPRIIVGSRGNFSLWSQGSSSLALGGDPLEISYNSGLGADGEVDQTLNVLEKTARDFIQKLNLAPTGVTLFKESVGFYAPGVSILNALPGRRGATLIQINFRYLLNNQPLFVRGASAPSLSVRINSSGKVVSLSGHWFPGLVRTKESSALLTYQAATQKIMNKEGVLTYLNSSADFNTESVFHYSVSLISVGEVVLGYYYSPGNTVLTPVYVFRGTAIDDSVGKTVSTVTLVSALP